MNRKLTFLLGIILLSFSFQSIAQKSFDSPEKIAEYAFKALKEGDHKKFAKIYPDEADVTWISEKVKGKEGKEAVKEMKEKGVEETKKIIARTSEDLNKIIMQAKENGVDLGEATYFKAVYDDGERDGIPFTDIHMIFKYQDSNYSIKLDDCAKVDGSWVSCDNPRWEGKYSGE